MSAATGLASASTIDVAVGSDHASLGSEPDASTPELPHIHWARIARARRRGSGLCRAPALGWGQWQAESGLRCRYGDLRAFHPGPNRGPDWGRARKRLNRIEFPVGHSDGGSGGRGFKTLRPDQFSCRSRFDPMRGSFPTHSALRNRYEWLGLRFRFESSRIASRFVGVCALHGNVRTILPSGPLSAIASFGSSEGRSKRVNAASLISRIFRLWAVGQEKQGCSPPRPRKAWHANTLRSCILEGLPSRRLFRSNLHLAFACFCGQTGSTGVVFLLVFPHPQHRRCDHARQAQLRERRLRWLAIPSPQ